MNFRISRTLLRTGIAACGFTVMAFAANLTGEFKGNWSSAMNPGTGALRVVVSNAENADPKCELFYTNGGDAEISAKGKSCKVDAAKLTAAFEADNDGGTIRIELTGTEDSKAITGDYKVYDSGGEVVNNGTWKASQSGS